MEDLQRTRMSSVSGGAMALSHNLPGGCCRVLSDIIMGSPICCQLIQQGFKTSKSILPALFLPIVGPPRPQTLCQLAFWKVLTDRQAVLHTHSNKGQLTFYHQLSHLSRMHWTGTIAFMFKCNYGSCLQLSLGEKSLTEEGLYQVVRIVFY